ncbi:hypothetical protein FMN12_03520, partial [Bacteroides acidifaciens]|nr:hypothetical protein [Bacteroides acidifaciens]
PSDRKETFFSFAGRKLSFHSMQTINASFDYIIASFVFIIKAFVFINEACVYRLRLTKNKFTC